MRSAKSFFNWSYKTRANTVRRIYEGQELSKNDMYLSFTSHNPAMVSYGPAGLNAAIKGVGFVPKREYLEETLQAYKDHIATYDPEDKTYSQRGLEVLMKHLYGPEAEERIDFSIICSIEMVKKHTWENYKENPEATLIYYQPPVISYELRGKMAIEEEGIYQQFINAQHDVYHAPNVERWKTRPAYIFTIEEIYDNGVSKVGFGSKMQFPY